MRLAMRISPSRVSSSTVPISRMYMRTGSVVRPSSASSAASAAAASSIASSSAGCEGSVAQQRLGIRCLLVHRDAHVVDGVDDVFDLLRIDDLGGQVIVHLRVGEVALLLAARDQQLQLRLAVFGHRRHAPLDAQRALVGGRACRAAAARAPPRPCRARGAATRRGRGLSSRAAACRDPCSRRLATAATAFSAAAGFDRLCWAVRRDASCGRSWACAYVSCMRGALAGFTLCAAQRRAAQGGRRQSAQFYSTGAGITKSKLARRARRGCASLTISTLKFLKFILRSRLSARLLASSASRRRPAASSASFASAAAQLPRGGGRHR